MTIIVQRVSRVSFIFLLQRRQVLSEPYGIDKNLYSDDSNPVPPFFNE